MQGNGAEEGIIAALDRIAREIDNWDVVVIIRGGGATSELGCFDTYDLANNCAQFPLPIITGIGHLRDESILDIVAHTSAKTPTAVAEYLIHSMLANETLLTDIQNIIATAVAQRMEAEKQRIEKHLGQIPVLTALYMQSQRHRLDLFQQRIEAASPEHILSLGYSITRLGGKAVRDTSTLKPGEEVETTVAGGTFTSIIK
jgi:exodeoxyribonuclease VII large subunit